VVVWVEDDVAGELEQPLFPPWLNLSSDCEEGSFCNLWIWDEDAGWTAGTAAIGA